MIDISKNITFAEATRTNTGIENIPGVAETKAMQHVAQTVFEPLRGHFGSNPIKINSFFRSRNVNKEVGGADTSQHIKGEAMDIKGTKEMFLYIKDNLPYDQLICEFPDKAGEPSWIHVSYTKGNNRYQVLRSRKVKGRTIYENYS